MSDLFSICKNCGGEYIRNRPKQRLCSVCIGLGIKLPKRRVKKRSKRTGCPSKQPCWFCEKYALGCSWSEEFKPVEGWEAEKVCTDDKETYKITYCPEFISDVTCRKCANYKECNKPEKNQGKTGMEECKRFKEK